MADFPFYNPFSAPIFAKDAQDNPSAPPAPYQGSLPAQPGYVTSLQGDPNGPPVAYRNPDLPPPTAQPQNDPSAGLPDFLRNWLNNDAVRAMVQQHIHQINAGKK